MSADLILLGGAIYTGEKGLESVEALAVEHGRIMATGPASEMAALAGPGTRTVRLHGRTVLPGLIDSHLHLLGFGLSLSQVDLQGASSIDEALGRVQAAVEGAAPHQWVQGAGWDLNLLGRLPTRQELDSISPRNPVLLASKDLHSLWVNTLALHRAGISGANPDPPGGEVVRDQSTGQPTGVLREDARKPLFEAVPPPSPEQIEAALLQAMGQAARSGLTGLQTFEGNETFAALQRIRRRQGLPLRVCCHVWADGLADALRLGIGTGFGDEWLRLGHLKLFLDGALGSRTAHMMEPYTGTHNRGIATMSAETLRDTVVRAAEGGIAVAMHAIGDAANRAALDVLEETSPVWRAAGLRPRIEHVQLLSVEDRERLGRIGVVASMQPIHAASDWQVAERHWRGRTGLAYAWRTIQDSGAVLAFGSDCPVETIDPMLGLYAAVTRQTVDGQPVGGWHPEQRLTPLEALRAYTAGAAYSSGEEAIKGSLSPGKVADFVVLSRDPISGPPETILDARVQATVVGGHPIYGEL